MDTVRSRRREVILVLAMSFGQSAVYAFVIIIAKLTEPGGLADQQSSLNTSVTPDRPWLDLTYQLLRIGFALVPAALAIHLLALDGHSPWRQLGLDRHRVGFDLGSGTGLALLIGVPGICLYLVARELGFNTTVVPTGLSQVWWAIPVLVLAAVQNAIAEEIVVVGYLMTRLRELRYRTATVIAASALLRGSYHLYQGFGGFIGNAVMGVVFALFFLRVKRTGPLIIAHSLMDIVVFVGFAMFGENLPWLS